MEIKPANQAKYRMDLLVFCNQLNMIGVRCLSSFLKSKGVDVRILYMISPVDSFEDIFSDWLYEKICEFCRGADLLGVSITTNFFPEARRLTGFLKKKLNLPIAWGGVHPTIEVEESLQYADYVIMGEGEEPTYELVKALAGKNDVSFINNLAFRKEGKVIKNRLRGLMDIGKLPMPDIDFTSHYLIDGNELKQITPELMTQHMFTYSNKRRVTYNISTTRGCPHSCTYCVNYAYRGIFGEKEYVRKMPVNNILEELTMLLNKYPFIEYISISDETFFIQDLEVIKSFAQQYKQTIGLPLKIEFSPETFNEEKLVSMLQAGAVELHMGVESGSEDTNYNIYNRRFPIAKIKSILNKVNSYSDLLEVVHIHILICNPFEALKNTKETFRFVVDVPNSFHIRFFPLVFFPGTKLLTMAMDAGFIKDRLKDIYFKTFNMAEALKTADYYTICMVFLHKLKYRFNINRFSCLLFYYFATSPIVNFILGSLPGRRMLFRTYFLLKNTKLFYFGDNEAEVAMRKSIKKIILYIESPFNKRDYKRFGIEVLKTNGFEVEVWDFTHIFHPGLDLIPRDPFEFPGLKIFKSKREALNCIMKLTPADMVISWFEYSYFRFFWIYRAMSRSRGAYSVIQVAAPVVFYGGSDESMFSKIRRIIGRSTFKASLFMVRDKLFSCIPYNLLGIKPAVYWFAGSDRSLEYFSFPKDNTTKIVYLHAFDYDLYLEKNSQNNLTKYPENAVFLDSYLPFHEDDRMDGLLHWVTADRYYPSLRRFFDYVEKEQAVKVDIAAHPRSFYEKHPDYFDKRALRIGQTIECVRDAKFIIAHDSNALNFAIIYYKPIIFIVTEEMIENNVASMVYKIASWFGKEPINIDRPLFIDWEKELKVDKNRYDRFSDAFIIKKGAEKVNSWKIIANKIKELNIRPEVITDENRKEMFPYFYGVKLMDGKNKYLFELLKRIFDGSYKLEQVVRCYCGFDDLEVLSAQDRFALPFGTKICRSCGLIQLSPRLSVECLPSYYEDIYWGLILGDSHTELSTGDKTMAREIYKYLEKHVNSQNRNKEMTIIEIGCGSGVKLIEIKALYESNNIKIKAMGCDYSMEAVNMANTGDITCRSGGTLSLLGEKADIVILSHIIEHFTDIKAEFENIRKLLKEGAYLYIETPGVSDLVNKKEYGYNYLVYSVMAHMYSFNLLSLRSVIEPLGFEFIDGDEYIRSIFRFSPGYRCRLNLSQNYKQIISSLKAAEEKRKRLERRFRPRLKSVVRKFINKI